MPDLLERLKSALADRYAVESEIGRGGMATVFLGQDLKHRRRVAIKVLHPELSAAVGPERFLREIEAVAGLTHPHVLPLYDSGEANGLLFYIMPYVEGESLRHRLDREEQLPVEEAIRITQEVAEALDHAHRNGLIHRDIKPGNILLEEGHAVVTDFGVARAISDVGTEKVTATGMAVGTPAYMSPEQAAGQEVSERSDLYALGCVLYEMLAGEPPLVGPTPQSTAAKRLTDRPTPLPALRGTVSTELSQAVETALEKAPVDRYATVPEFAEALGSITPGVVGSTPVRRARRRMWVGLGTAVVLGAAAVAAWFALRPTGETSTPDPNAIAVLPFADMSPGKDQEYFSDGISEELLNLLAKIPELRVTSRSSAFFFKGQGLAIPEIAERLNVAHILEGSVRTAGNDVRITAQLIDARSDTHMWSDTWDRTLDDIFEIQDEIAAEVVAQLKITLLGDAPKATEIDPEAYALFLQARQLGRQFTAEGWQQSNILYRRALEIDLDYAAAWVGLARNYINQANNGYLPVDEGHQLAREAVNRALAIDPELAEAHAHLSLIATYDSDLAAAARHLERALKLGPTNPDIVLESAKLAVALSRLDEAIALHEYAVARDPVNPVSHAFLAVAYLFAGRLDEAIASYRTALSLSPGFSWAQYMIGMALLMKADPAQALAAMQQESSEAWRVLGLSMAYHALGQDAESDAALAELIDKHERTMAYNVAYVLSFRGEADDAFEWLDKAVEYRDTGLRIIAADVQLAKLSDDPRWLPFLESIGRSPEQLAAIEFEVTLPK
jgi:serine/threonine protein kinase/Flp pilus assembly protein TadD